MNLIILIFETIIVFSLLLLSKKLFGKQGVIAWVGLASVLANIQTAKSIDLIGITSNLGTVLFASTFLATDILNECYGKKEAKRAVYIGLFSVIVFMITIQITLWYRPSSIDMVSNAMDTVFALSPRICVASIVTYFIANLLDVYLYDKLKIKYNGKKMWLRNNISTIICNSLENIVFITLAFYGIFGLQDMFYMMITMSIIEVVIALCDTPFLYIAKHQGS